MKVTLDTLSQIGLANVSLLTVHYNPAVQDIVEEIIIELVEEPLKKPFLELVSIVEKEQKGDPVHTLKTFGTTISTLAASSKSNEEFSFLVNINVRIWRVWKLSASDCDSTEESVRDHCYRDAAAEIAKTKTHKWAQRHEVMLPIADVTSVAATLYEMLKSGAYFTDAVYDRPVEMGKGGQIRLTDTDTIIEAVDDDWGEFFDGSEDIH